MKDHPETERSEGHAEVRGAYKGLARALMGGVAVLSVLALVLLLLAGTEPGTRRLWHLASDYVPGLSSQSIAGTLLGDFSVQNVTWSDDYQTVAVETLSVSWQPLELLRSTLHVTAITVHGLEITNLGLADKDTTKSGPIEFSLPAKFETPIDLMLDRLEVRDLNYRSNPDAEPLYVRSGDARASFIGTQLGVSQLDLDSPLFRIEAKGSLTTAGTYPAALTVNWSAMSPDFAQVRGEFTIDGDRRGYALRHSVAPPYGLLQEGRFSVAQQQLSYTLKSELLGVQLAEFGDISEPLALTGFVTIASVEQGHAATLDIQSAGKSFANPSLVGDVLISSDAIDLTGIEIATDTDVRITVTGRVALPGVSPALGPAMDPALDMAASWTGVRWPLVGEEAVVAPAGNLSLTGTLDDYRLQGETLLSAPKRPEGTLSIEGSGNLERFTLEQLRMQALGGELLGTGSASWSPELDANLTLNGQDIDLTPFSASLPNSLSVDVRVAARQRDGSLTATVERISASGNILDRPFEVDTSGSFVDSTLNLNKFVFSAGPSILEASGRAGETLDFEWQLFSPELSSIYSQAGGRIEGSGRLQGTRATPALKATLHAVDLAYGAYSVAELDLDADIDPERLAPSSLELSVSSAQLDGTELRSLRLTGGGNRERHRLTLTADSAPAAVDLTLDGTALYEATGTRWNGELVDGRVRPDKLAEWQLTEAHTLSLAASEQAVGTGCWASGEARLCFGGNRADAQSSTDLSLEKLALSYFKPLLPNNLTLAGAIDAEAALGVENDQDLRFEAKLNSSAVTLRKDATSDGPEETERRDTKKTETLLAFLPSSIIVTQNKSQLRASLSLPLAERPAGSGLRPASAHRSMALDTGSTTTLPDNPSSRLSARQAGVYGEVIVPVTPLSLTSRPIDGIVNLNLPSITALSDLVPELDRADGQVAGGFDIAGTIAEPVFAGGLELTDGRLQLVTPGLDVEGIDLEVRSVGGQSLEFSGDAESGGGQLSYSGDAKLGGAQPVYSITLSGDAFQIANTDDVRAYISPDLSVRSLGSALQIRGSVLVPKASVTPTQLPESAVSPSRDQVIIGADGVEQQSALGTDIDARLRITLGDEVSVDGFGFSGRLTGSLQVEQQPQRPTLATGELNILDGEYRAYGQGLVIEQGKVLFAGGPIGQPGIQVRANRRPAADVLVGVNVRGPIERPQFSLYSEPTMSQTEMLSWLVLGQPLQGSSEGQEDMLAQAATMLGIKGGNYLADRFGGDLGVDSIGFETGSGEAGAASDVNQAAFVIGKYLSPDLFVSYGIGLFDSVSTITLEYILNKNWRLSTQSSTIASGGDVTYTVER
ncbi:MAG: translocation/assembly module TamB domain-containing protein [Pseudomonadota bacterium]